MNIDKIKVSYISAVYQTGAFLVKAQPFQLRSGKQSHLYLNHRQFLTQSIYLSLIAKAFTALIQQKLNEFSLGVVDSIMSPIIAGAISTHTEANIVVVKSKKLAHGMQDDIYGSLDKEIVIVDDMTSTGNTIIEVIKKIRKHGGHVNYCVVCAERDPTGANNLLKEGVKLLSIANFTEIVDSLKDKLTEDELLYISSELNNDA